MYYMIAWYGGEAHEYPGAEVKLFDNKEDAKKAIDIIKSQKDNGYGLWLCVAEVESVDLYIQNERNGTYTERQANKGDVDTIDSIRTGYC